jgi:hypothetical protein
MPLPLPCTDLPFSERKAQKPEEEEAINSNDPFLLMRLADKESPSVNGLWHHVSRQQSFWHLASGIWPL